MLPQDILNLIDAYRLQFEKVDEDIQTAINSYHTIESRATQLLREVEEMELCEYHVNNLRRALQQTVLESGRIVSEILETEEIHVVQQEMLLALNNEILYDVFNILLHPFYFTDSM